MAAQRSADGAKVASLMGIVLRDRFAVTGVMLDARTAVILFFSAARAL
jgi:hypothetical protein